MRTEYFAILASLASVTLLVAYESTSHPVTPKLQTMSFANSEWSAPANLKRTLAEENP